MKRLAIRHLKFQWPSREFFARLGQVTLGSLIGAVGVNLFLVPQNLLTAGVAGLAVLLSFLTSLPSGAILFVLNIPIFLAAARIIDREFVWWSLLGMGTLSAGLAATEPLATLRPVSDPYLNILAGSVVVGFGSGLVFRARATQGGTDVLVAILRRYYAIPIGTALLALNTATVTVLALVYGLEPALYTIVVIWLESQVLERTIIGVDANKAMMVITDQPEEVAKALLEQVGRGVTFLYGRGAYTGREKKVVYCIVTVRQLAHAKKVVRSVDPHCFTTVHDVVEVIGKGFRQSPI